MLLVNLFAVVCQCQFLVFDKNIMVKSEIDFRGLQLNTLNTLKTNLCVILANRKSSYFTMKN